MPRSRSRKTPALAERFPPSAPCACEICVGYCARPGWWTVAEAASAIQGGLAARMMLELAPDRSYGVLSPAFPGCEGGFALQECAPRGCGFLKDCRCELFGSSYQPLECRFCHHARPGLGPLCHAALEADWATPPGRALVAGWCRRAGLSMLLEALGLRHLKAPGD
jgi:hypothetical protein